MPARKVRLTTTNKKLPALKEEYGDRALYDWKTIRDEYIEGYKNEDGVEVWPTVKELCDRYDVPERSLANRIAKERWSDYRRAHQNQIALERQKERAKVLAHKAVKFDETTTNIANFGLNLVQQRFDELLSLDATIRANRELIITAAEVDGRPFRVSDVKASALSGAELESLSKAAALFVEIGRKGYGLKDGEPALLQNTNNTQVNQINISEDFLQTDAERVKGLFRVLSNKNLSIPEITTGDEEEDIEDAEILSITDEMDEE